MTPNVTGRSVCATSVTRFKVHPMYLLSVIMMLCILEMTIFTIPLVQLNSIQTIILRV